MNSVADAIPTGMADRMHCKRYHADISVSTCLARRKKALAVGPSAKWGSAGVNNYDPGCVDCNMGKVVAAEYGDSVTFLERRPAPRRPIKIKETSVKMKICKRCEQEKDVEEFYRIANMKDGRDSSCKKCRNEASSAAKRSKAPQGAAVVKPEIPEGGGILDTDRPSVSAADPVRVPGDPKRLNVYITIDCAGIIDALREIIAPSRRRKTNGND